MLSYTTQWPFFEECLRTFYSLQKHVRERHDEIKEATLIPKFKDEEGKETVLPIPRETLDHESKAGYRMWLIGVIERISSAFHPRLPGK